MTAQDLYGVLVRFVGFGLIVYGGYTAIWGIAFVYMPHFAAASADAEKTTVEHPGTYLFAAAIFVGMGAFIISESDLIAQLSYAGSFFR